MSRQLAGETLTALFRPRRALPIAVVVVALTASQVALTPSVTAGALALLLCGVFVAVGPVSWRALLGGSARPSNAWVGLGLYGALGIGVVFIFAWWLPRLLGMPATLLSDKGSLLVEPALFWVGGWGLGRDIELEQGLAQAQARVESLAKDAEHAQLLAMQRHLDPHFLFNTLNAIAEWCREDPEVAERAIVRLSDMLRVLLDGIRHPTWPLSRELDLTRDLFELHRIRDPEAFDVVIEVDGAVDGVVVPALLLLPLAENAMTHGPRRGSRGEVRLAVSVVAGAVTISLDNPGCFAPDPAGPGSGIETVRRRLALAYGADAALTVGPCEADEAHTRARLVLPAHPSGIAS